VAGLLLAAGSGRRYGMPKALVDQGSGPWVQRAYDTLARCALRVVVVGASAGDVARLLPADAIVVGNPDHAEGMGSSLRRGLLALTALNARRAVDRMDRPAGADPSADSNSAAGPDVPRIDAAVVMLVDLPGVGADVIDRVCEVAGSTAAASGVLARATFDGVPSHPVLIGRSHWAGVIASAHDDVGARDYLAQHRPVEVECADIGSGLDVDTPAG
jgi:CTP:molybdopterin cytidylyltransferase MocA